MTHFTQNNRNVHKELEETLSNASRVMEQYFKVKSHRPITDVKSKVLKTIHTQTREIDIPMAPVTQKTSDESVLKEIRSRLTEQAEQISILASIITSGEDETGQWTDVVKRKQRKYAAEERPTLKSKTRPLKRTVKSKSRLPAILVQAGKKEFPALVQKPPNTPKDRKSVV